MLTDEERSRRLSRCCKACGKCMHSLDLRKTSCSNTCGQKARRKPTVVVPCSLCGKLVVRYADHTHKRQRFACSLDCQRVIAGKAGKDHVKASLKAKKKWHRKQSARRRTRNQWLGACISAVLRLSTTTVQSEWARKCCSVSTMLRHRRSVLRSRGQRRIATWREAISTQQDAIKARVVRAEHTAWERKCETTARSMQHRIQRKRQHKS